MALKSFGMYLGPDARAEKAKAGQCGVASRRSANMPGTSGAPRKVKERKDGRRRWHKRIFVRTTVVSIFKRSTKGIFCVHHITSHDLLFIGRSMELMDLAFAQKMSVVDGRVVEHYTPQLGASNGKMHSSCWCLLLNKFWTPEDLTTLFQCRGRCWNCRWSTAETDKAHGRAQKPLKVGVFSWFRSANPPETLNFFQWLLGSFQRCDRPSVYHLPWLLSSELPTEGSSASTLVCLYGSSKSPTSGAFLLIFHTNVFFGLKGLVAFLNETLIFEPQKPGKITIKIYINHKTTIKPPYSKHKTPTKLKKKRPPPSGPGPSWSTSTKATPRLRPSSWARTRREVKTLRVAESAERRKDRKVDRCRQEVKEMRSKSRSLESPKKPRLLVSTQ